MENRNNNNNRPGGNNGNNGGYNNNNRRPQNRNNQRPQQEEKLFSELIELRRVTKATTGGKRMSFRVIMIAGDKKGNIGIAMGKGADTQEAIQKAMKRASVKLMNIPLNNEGKTIPHRVEADYKSSSVLIKPAPIGTGVVAGGAIRKVLEMAGIENVVAKRLGSANSLTNAYCTIVALSKLKEIKRGNRPQKDSSK
jgi:small subunit ribosomal protein S5